MKLYSYYKNLQNKNKVPYLDTSGGYQLIILAIQQNIFGGLAKKH
jgi:hypothetical protein